MVELTVNTQSEYVVKVTRGIDGLQEFVRARARGERIAVITDENVNAIYGGALYAHLGGYEVHEIVLPSGETTKSIEHFYSVIRRLAALGFTRRDTVITFGGGVVGDLGAFVASTYMRGINLIAVPTTLLAMVDSSVGGKTAIDLPEGKNLCGTFYQPSGVYVNVDFLATLPKREYLSGMGEVVKYAYLGGGVNGEMVQGDVSEELIVECLKIKRDIVSADEKEGGARKLLNLGHTVGHAIESLSAYTLSHGECVARGICAALKVSQELGYLTREEREHGVRAVAEIGLPTDVNFPVKQIVEKIKNDKKSTHDGVDFIVVKGGVACIERLTLARLEELLK